MTDRRPDPRARRWVPEVVQTSDLDCGPAALAALLEGCGIPTSAARLREACQTDVDGTSIEALGEVARLMGLCCEQQLVPLDGLLDRTEGVAPAIVVTRGPGGGFHFVLLWGTRLGRVQVMDPAVGRRWLGADEFLGEVHPHRARLSEERWRAFAQGPTWRALVLRRLASLGCGAGLAKRLVDQALEDTSWHGPARLEAAIDFGRRLVSVGGARRGREVLRLVEATLAEAAAEPEHELEVLGEAHWATRPTPGVPGELLVRGAVVLRALGRSDAPAPLGLPAAARDSHGQAATEDDRPGHRHEPMPRERPAAAASRSAALAAARSEPRPRPWRAIWNALAPDVPSVLPWLVPALLLAAAAVIAQGLLFQGLIEVGRSLGGTLERGIAVFALVLFLIAALLLEIPAMSSLLRLGRRLEARLRLTFQERLPRVAERFLASRTTSDVSERAHAVTALRQLPMVASRAVRVTAQLVLTAAGLVWLDPASLSLVVAACLLALAIPVLAQRTLGERDLRMRSHGGALTRFYLDALLGAIPIRTHGAGRALAGEQEALLARWQRAGRSRLTAGVWVDAVQAGLSLGIAATLVLSHLLRDPGSPGLLLFAYWSLGLPTLAAELIAVGQILPAMRAVALRWIEPLGAPEEESTVDVESVDSIAASDRRGLPAGETGLRAAGASGAATILPGPGSPSTTPGVATGVAIRFEGAAVMAGGRSVLEAINLDIAAGEHVAIVGASGAGKSTLLSLLLGFSSPSAGQLHVDGASLRGERVAELRRATTWVDPELQIWNRSLADNLRDGLAGGVPADLASAIDAAELESVVEGLQGGLQEALGEGGRRLSGGEGQRVRLARAFLRDARLVLLDEAFRGLDRARRVRLLATMRARFAGSTLVCVTHDIDCALDFRRVVVLEAGRVVEDGDPRELERADSRFAELLAAHRSLVERLGGDSGWRRLVLRDGRLRSEGARQPLDRRGTYEVGAAGDDGPPEDGEPR
ncbi:ATP-binding cassette domain-containing protein [Engelhardtia mirabilis]|uniref:Heterocyst differentiation ATP-binding protein HepA n=1 Tax=Engelhardtia mirabilis TaxID=2528011 RepID=A0A518BHK3_9BACT|nr:Heterocyst differentiation ATP-binding protein HepA [Planctomycetes bacterium Pla133]QDV00796.1 Heterocyst differentiation ATP-binding protein HepA [Planctomycetes bacterium Pla86]